MRLISVGLTVVTFAIGVKFSIAILQTLDNNNSEANYGHQRLVEQLRLKYPHHTNWGKYNLPAVNNNNNANINNKQPIEVKMTLLLGEILNHPDSTVTFGASLLLKWHDDNLKWSRKQLNGIDLITLPVDYIWHPDVLALNDYLSRFYVQFKDGASVGAWVYHNGDVVWNPPVSYRIQCIKETSQHNRNYVTKTCNLSFASIVYTAREMKLVFDPDTAGANWNLDFYAAFPGITIQQSSAEPTDQQFFAPAVNSHYAILTYKIIIGINLATNEPVHL